MKLSKDQIEAVVQWMNTWEQLRGTVIPMRFREDWDTKPRNINLKTNL